MTVFFLSAILIIILAPLSRKSNTSYLLLIMGYLAILTMFRSASVGTDTRTYTIIYDQIASMNLSQFKEYLWNTGTEIGYVIFCRLLSYISTNPQILLIATGLITYFSLTYFFILYSKIPLISVYMFFMLGGFDFFASGIRQSMSIAFILLAYICIKKRKKVFSLIFLILSVLFHYSSIFAVLIGLLVCAKKVKHYRTIVLLSSCFAFVFFAPLLQYVLRLLPKYNYYVNSVLFVSEAKLALILKIIVFSLIFLVGKYVGISKNKGISLDDVEFTRSAYIVPFIYFVSSRARACARLAVTFMPFVYIYFPNAIESKDKKSATTIKLLLVICFFAYALTVHLLKTPEWQQTYPYSFWHN